MSHRKLTTIANIKNKVLALNQKFLTNDFEILEGNKIIMSVAVSAILTIEYTRNGTDYISVNSDVSQASSSGYRYQIDVFAGDTFNVRIKETTATTLELFTAELYLET